MSCTLQDCLKFNFVKIEGNPMMGNLSSTICSSTCFDMILNYIKQILDNLPQNQPLHITTNSDEYLVSPDEYEFNCYIIPKFKTIKNKYKDGIKFNRQIDEDDKSYEEYGLIQLNGDSNEIVEILRTIAIDNPYNPIQFILDISLLNSSIHVPEEPVSIEFGLGREVFANRTWESVSRSNSVRRHSSIYHPISLLYVPEYPKTDISDFEEISENPDVVILKFPDNSVVCTTNKALRTYLTSKVQKSEEYLILPPKVDYSKNTCFDLINFEDVPINNFMEGDYYDRIIIRYENKTTCMYKSELKNLLTNNQKLFFNCSDRGSSGQPILPRRDYRLSRVTPDFILINLVNGQYMIKYDNFVEQLFSKNAYEYIINPLNERTDNTASKSVALGEADSYVSGNHCQNGTQVSLYEIKAVELTNSYKLANVNMEYFNYLSSYKNREYFVVKEPVSELYYLVPPTLEGEPDFDILNVLKQFNEDTIHTYSYYNMLYPEKTKYSNYIENLENIDYSTIREPTEEENIFGLDDISKLFLPSIGIPLTEEELNQRVRDRINRHTREPLPIENDINSMLSAFLETISSSYLSTMNITVKDIREYFAKKYLCSISSRFYPLIKAIITRDKDLLFDIVFISMFYSYIKNIDIYFYDFSSEDKIEEIKTIFIETLEESEIEESDVQLVLDKAEIIAPICGSFIEKFKNFLSEQNLLEISPRQLRTTFIDMIDQYNGEHSIFYKKIVHFDTNEAFSDFVTKQQIHFAGFKYFYNDKIISFIFKDLISSNFILDTDNIYDIASQFYLDNRNFLLTNVNIETTYNLEYIFNRFFIIYAKIYIYIKDSKIPEIINEMKDVNTSAYQLLTEGLNEFYSPLPLIRNIYKRRDLKLEENSKEENILLNFFNLLLFRNLINEISIRETEDIASITSSIKIDLFYNFFKLNETRKFLISTDISEFEDWSELSGDILIENSHSFISLFLYPLWKLTQSYIATSKETLCTPDIIYEKVLDDFVGIGDGFYFSELLENSDIKTKLKKLIENLKDRDDIGYNPYCGIGNSSEYIEDVQEIDQEYFSQLELGPDTDLEMSNDDDDSQPMDDDF